MQEYYFFKNVKNYDELVEKTKQSILINSINKREVYITKTLSLSMMDFNELSLNFLKNQKYLFEYLSDMYIGNGIWNCIAVISDARGILVMSDGYQYARFTALLNDDNTLFAFDKSDGVI